MSRFCFFFFKIEKKYTLLLFHRCKCLGPAITSQMAFHVPDCDSLFIYMAFYKACGIKVFFSFSFSDLFSMKYLNDH